MLEPEAVEHGGVPVVVVHDVLDGLVAPFIGFAIRQAALEAAAGYPLAEAVGIMVAAPLGLAGVVLEHRQTAHLAAPVDDGAVEETALFEVGDQRGARAVGGGAEGGEGGLDRAVAVPALALVEDLHVTYAALDEPAGDEAAAGVVVALLAADAVEFEDVLRLGGDVEGFLGGDLHAAGELIALDAGLQVALARVVGRVFGVKGPQEFHLAFLRFALERGGRVEVEDVRGGGADERALVDRRQPAVGPVLVGEGRQAGGMPHHDVGGQVLGLAAERIGRPGAQGRVAGGDASRLHGEHGLEVIVHSGLHRTDQADVVGDRA